MRKLIFTLQTMVLGGVEKELITVLNKIHNKFDITLLLLYLEDKEILKDIPEDVKIIILDINHTYYHGSTSNLIKHRLKNWRIFESAMLAVKRFLRIGMTSSNININEIPSLDDLFDVAVCYHMHSPLMLKYVVEKISAKKKIVWIHNDFYSSGYPVQRLKKYVAPYNEVVAVSKKVENEFRELCPWYKGVISVAHNYLDATEIIKLSEEEVDNEIFLKEKNVKLLTIGRFDSQKGIDIAIRVCAMLKKKNLQFHWFLIGYGDLESVYRRMIKQLDVDDKFSIIGKKSNPYPYIKNCDICVQPSRHEAYPLVIMEGKILKKPIICTNFNGADEQLENGVNGIIVPLNDIEALFQELSNLISFPNYRMKISNGLENYTTDDDLQKIIEHFE